MDVFIQCIRSMFYLCVVDIPIPLVKLLCVHHWPNISNQRITTVLDQNNTKERLRSNDMNAIFHSFTHVKQFHVAFGLIIDLPRFLNHMPITVSNMVNQHPVNVIPSTYHEFIT